MANELTKEVKQYLAQATKSKKETVLANDITYPIYLTIQEIMLAEESLFERSTVLSAIADLHTKEERKNQGESLDKKVAILEAIARKIASPIDEMYAYNEGLANV